MADKKKRDALAGVNMAMALDDQSARDLAKLKRMIKKPRRIRTKPVDLNVKSNSIQKPGAFGIERNTIMKARFGGKVVQKMQDGGAKLSQAEIDAAIREIAEQGTVFGKGRELSKDQTKKIADKFEADFAKMFGKRFGGAIRKMRKGGLMEAIKKVQAKEMQGGGEAKSGGKSVSINTPTGRRKMAEIRKLMPGASVDEVKEFGLKAGILKMQLGGDVPKPKPRPKSLKADKTESLNKKFSAGVSATNKKNMKNVKKDAVPPKFKGFSKLPEKVQQKIDPNLADKYEMGGKVEKYGAGGNVKGGKMGCRGMGAALRGGGFSIR